MRNIKLITLIFVVALLMIGCSSGQKKYEEFMESAIQEMENGDLEKVNEYLKQALEEKPEDEMAISYREQVADLIATTEEIAAGKLSEATKKIDKIINNEDNLAVLVKLAKDLAGEIKELEDAYETYHAELDQAQQYLTNKELEKAKQSIEKIEQENLTNPFYKDLQEDISELKQETAKAEKEKRIIDSFKGYWLKDTMACHIADTYVACALAESDFITYDEIVEINLISDTEIEITFEDNIKNTIELVDRNSLELADGVYKRVTKEEANAIYGGYYELP